MRKLFHFSVGILFLLFVIGLIFYFYLPEKIVNHWNAQGIGDGYSSKFWGLFLIPIISLILFIFFYLIPLVDPLKNNLKKFKRYYELFILLFLLFMFYVEVLIIFANLGFIFNMVLYFCPAFAVLYFCLGFILEKSKRNWFVGIRTPWTLSSDEVWEATNKLGGKLFKISGIISITGIFFENYAIGFILIPVIIFSVYLIIYSYIKYKN